MITISVYSMIDLILKKMGRSSDIKETPKGYSVRCLSNSHDDKHHLALCIMMVGLNVSAADLVNHLIKLH